MDETKKRHLEQVIEFLKNNEGATTSKVIKQFGFGSEYASELITRALAEEAGIEREKILTLDEMKRAMETSDESDKDIVLTDEQKERILQAWNVEKIDSLKELTQLIFGKDFDGRSKQAKALKEFLSSRQLQARSTHFDQKQTRKIVLSLDQREFIKNHISQLTPLEITQSLFSDPHIQPLSAEARAVRYFIDNVLPPSSFRVKVRSDFKEVTVGYTPPRTMEEAIRRINAFVFEKLDISKINPRQKANTQGLMHYVNVHRFQMIMNEFIDQRDRDLMESSFVRFVYDKGDLSEEEVDLYINWCLDIVHHTQLIRELNQLKVIRDQSLDDKGTPPKALVDQMNKILEAIDQNQKRQKSAQNDLSGKRKDRVNGNHGTANVAQLIEGFKDHRKRKLLIQFAESRKKLVAEEIDNLSSMDDVRFEFFGSDKDELMNGL